MLVWERLRSATPDFDQLVDAIPEEKVTIFIKEKMAALEKYRLERDEKQKWFEIQITSTGREG